MRAVATDSNCPRASHLTRSNLEKEQAMNKFLIAACVPMLAFLLGAGVGVAAQPEPEVIQTTETETVEVPVVPDVCLAALGAGERVIESGAVIADITVQYIGMIPRAAEAGMNADASEIDALTSEMEALTQRTNDETEKVEASNYDGLADHCRSLAR